MKRPESGQQFAQAEKSIIRSGLKEYVKTESNAVPFDNP
jgi:hypothetical protein